MRIWTIVAVFSSFFVLWRLLQRARARALSAKVADAARALEQLLEESSPSLPWDSDIVGSISMPIERKAHEVGLASLGELESTIVGPLMAVALLGNGGFAYWLGMYDRHATLAVVDAFTRLGLPAQADVMRASLTVFPNALPPDDVQERRRAVESLSASLLAVPAERIYGAQDEINVRILRHIRANRRALVALHPSIAKPLERLDEIDAHVPDALRRLAAESAVPLALSALDVRIAERDYTGALRTLIASDADDACASGSPDHWRRVEELAAELHLGELAAIASARVTGPRAAGPA